MRLTQLEIFGFKSFAQKVVIPFDPGITAIVGPNGCGKSNVVEAIRWVLGEQRAGAFRSHRMEDVIFAGTRNRKPLGMSEVALTIDNSENILPVEFSEVTLTRRLFRSGDSDYLMNKIPCRLLDITNLLMDTGLGQGAYAVMEQGMVDEIISEKTENRRRILEEAAGITKYKARRRSTWNKLESTQADLTRIEDIIAEVKRQVDYLSRQVGRARRYQELKQELDQLELLLGRYRFFAIGAQLAPLKGELGGLNRSAEEGYTRFTSREAELEKMRLEQTQAEKALQEVGIQLNQRVEQIHARERDLVAVRERQESAEQFIERAGREREDYARQLETARQQRQENARSLQERRAQLQQTEENLEGHEQGAEEIERQYASSRESLEGSQRQQMESLRQQGELSRSLERQRAEREGVAERARRLQEEVEGLEKERHRARQASAAVQADLEALRAGRQQVQDLHEETRLAILATGGDIRRLRERADAARRAAEANQARLHALEKVRSGYEGYSSGVRALMLDSPCAELFHGVVGDLIDVQEDARQAVETALGESLEALVAGQEDTALEAIRHLRERTGRAGIFALERPAPPLPPPAPLSPGAGLRGPLLDFVRADERLAPLVERLLHNTFLVDDLDAALALSRRHPEHHLRFVTPGGDAIDLFGRIAGGRLSGEDASVLGRRQEIGALRTLIAHGMARRHALEICLRAEERRLAVLEGRSAALASRLQGLRDRERERQHQQQSAGTEERRLALRLEQLGGERQQLDERARLLVQAIAAQEERLGKAETAAQRLQEEIGQAEQRLAQSEAVRQEKRDQLAALRVERARMAETAHSLQRDAERLAHIEQGLVRNIERLQREQEQAEANREELGGRIRELEEGLKELHGEREGLDQERDRRQQRWAEVSTRNRELEEHISRLQRELNTHRERRHQLELKIAELENRAAHIRERLQEEQHKDVETMGAPGEEVDEEGIQQRVDELRQSLQRLGSVHLGVLEEFGEQKERYDFLCQQRDDLVVAAEDLKKLLGLIDRTARRMFLETFEKIREKFRETFARFFPGGEADLKLHEDADALEAGIDIIARPRGKRLQSIALLSGGERALTAISLLFAIYLVKPSPFCILDEVDAPLDDTNIGRFVRVLKEFARTTQFIMVTHNKISMSAADTLHGVTMPEEGVSQLVSVKVDEYEMEEAAG